LKVSLVQVMKLSLLIIPNEDYTYWLHFWESSQLWEIHFVSGGSSV
jgi:hypothetical protein